LHCLDRRNFAPIVVIPAQGELSAALDAMRIPTLTCPHLCRLHHPQSVVRFMYEGWQLVAGALALSRIVRAHAPDVVHANSTTAALFALLGARRSRRPLVSHWRDAAAHVIRPLLIYGSTCIVVPSEFCRARLLSSASPAMIDLIPNGIEIDRFA